MAKRLRCAEPLCRVEFHGRTARTKYCNLHRKDAPWTMGVSRARRRVERLREDKRLDELALKEVGIGPETSR